MDTQSRSEPRAMQAMLVVAVALALWLLTPLWEPVLIAAVLAVALAPLDRRLSRHLGWRWAAPALLTWAVFLLVTGPLSAMAVAFVREALAIEASFREALQRGGLQAGLAKLPQALRAIAAKVVGYLQLEPGGKLPTFGFQVPALLTGVFQHTATFLLDLVMMLVALFFFLLDGAALVEWLTGAAPLAARTTRGILEEFRRVSLSVLASIFVAASAQGAAATLGYVLFDVPYPLFFGLLTFLVSFVPVVGTATIALPLAAWLALTGHPVRGLVLAIWSLVIVGLVDNVVQPLVVKGGMRVHGGVVLFSLVCGVLLFGAIGVVVGPLIVTLLVTLVRRAPRTPAGVP